jgi:large subunit ribosomal protein L24
MKSLFKKNDQVVAISGRSRGKRGKVLAIYGATGRVLVEGLNFVKKCRKPTQQNPQGGIVDIESPIAASNIMLYCGKCQRPVRTARRLLKDGNKERTCKKCGEAL